MITEECKQHILDRIDIVDLIGKFVKLKKEGANYKGLCPFHNEKSPSFTVSASKDFFKCFGCGKSGNGVNFIQQHEGLTFAPAMEYIAELYNIQMEYTTPKKKGEPEKYEAPIGRLEKLSKKLIDWFENERKISNNTLLRFGITESREYFPQLKQEAPSICFNYFQNEELINIKFRGPQKSFKLVTGAKKIFYNIDAIKDEETCIITEGEIDCLTMYECGFYNAVSVPNGASASNHSNLDYLTNCLDYFKNKTRIYLFTDNDQPGRNLKDELCRRLGYDRCYQIDYPEGCKDPNEVFIKHGKAAVALLIENARKIAPPGIRTMDDMYETIVDFYENGYPQGCKAYLGDFDDLLTFYPGQMTLVTGIPGSGKSEVVDWICCGLAKHHEWHIGVASFENPPEFQSTKLIEKMVGKSFAFRKNPEHRVNIQEFGYAIGMIDKYFHFMDIPLIDITIDGLIEKAEQMVHYYGIRCLVLDPWNCIEHKYDGQETQYILESLNKLLIFADKFKVHLIIVAHPTKLKKDPKTGKYEIPTMYSISGSAHFFNRTHNGISVYRDFETDLTDIYVQKVKWSWLGKVGFATYKFDTFTRKYNAVGA